MSDDPTQVLRLYFVIDVSTLAAVPTEAQWQSLIQQAKTKPLAAAILGFARASQNFITAHKRALGTGLMKYTLGVFEIEASQKAAALTLLNTEAAKDSVIGSATAKFAGTLQHELRQAAVDLGYTTTQANKLVVTVINAPGLFDRDSAMAAAQQYLADNDAVWHAATGEALGEAKA